MGALLSQLIRNREEEVAGGSEKKDERRESGNEVAENYTGENQEINAVNNDKDSIGVNGGESIEKKSISNLALTESVNTPDKSNYCTINGYISRVGVGVGRADNDRQFVFCNGRPVDLPKFTKVLNEVITDC